MLFDSLINQAIRLDKQIDDLRFIAKNNEIVVDEFIGLAKEIAGTKGIKLEDALDEILCKHSKDENREARWNGNGFGEYKCSQCWNIVNDRTKICKECYSIMDDREE